MGINQMLALPERIRHKIVSLTERSHHSHMDLNTALPWSQGIDKGLYPKRPDTCFIYGTAAWDALTPEQRLQLAWDETVRDVSMFIWLEQTLPPLYVGFINKQGHLLPDYLKDYLLVFSKEEIVHIQVFRRYMEMLGLPLYGAPPGLHELCVEKLPTMHPVVGILCTLLLEWVAENGAQHCVASDAVDPLTRRLFRAHHREELRHIAFARWVVSALAPQLPAPEQARLRQFTETLVERLFPQYTINAEIATRVPFPLGFTLDDETALHAARYSPNNLRINDERFSPIIRWVRENELVSPGFTFPCMPAEGPAGAA